MTKRQLKKLLLVAGTLVFSIGIGEGLVRVLFPHSRDSAIPGHVFQVDDVLGWRFQPGVRSVHRTRHFDVEYVINASGFRDVSKTEPGTARERRISLYGDSLVFGWGLPQSDRFTDLLDARVDGLEVWNRGVPGYGLDQQILSYTRDAETLAVDEAMFFVSSSTLARMHERYIYTKYKPVFVLDEVHGLQLRPVPRMLNRGVDLMYKVFSPFYLPYFLQERLSLLKAKIESRASRPTSTPSEPRHVDSLSKLLLQRALTTAHRKGQRVSVLVGHLGPKDRAELQYFCQQNAIGFFEIPLDVAAAEEDLSRMDLILGPDDRHWSSKANRVIADELETRLSRR
jgi:hypothetical protein